MTYLDLVNSVLRRLREEEVATVSDTEYSKLIGDFVNDAYQNVESAWDWTALRSEIDITTIAGTDAYSLTGFGVRGKIFDVLNTTTNTVVYQENKIRNNQTKAFTENARGVPKYYHISGIDVNKDAQLILTPTPDAAYAIKVYAEIRQGSLVNDADEISVPTQPIIQFAFAYALRERGETGGQSASEQLIFAQEDLRTAITLDQNYHPDETTWNVT